MKYVIIKSIKYLQALAIEAAEARGAPRLAVMAGQAAGNPDK